MAVLREQGQTDSQAHIGYVLPWLSLLRDVIVVVVVSSQGRGVLVNGIG